DELLLVVGKKHRFAGKKSVNAADLGNERWVLFERGASIRRATDDFFKTFQVKPEKALESNDTYFVKLMVEHGLGVSLMPTWAVEEEVAAGRLAKVRIRDHKLRRSVAMVLLKGSRSRTIRAFIDFILERKGKLQTAASG
ncbi:MAG: LysR family transcriptional regulator substrate-binding protein, partial [Acidobacteria bacterium]|nr:LysR family transcriptional regulator substrate-binding protein [Acidobacteriota bacterium]